ncbi:MAG: class I SAM-dependent methyltransferase [SAR202 cluster bacterium]|jgi:SAM-dependent methyltransferase|nr:hypothetical protein [Chloroflexota bacterium]MQG59572.1 class I SAM-dependent methyltransferase [SAR202 cluster bacterium]MQG68480.1 class I SAM-dependent methyltransferase [SAR202 cluster bacterium]HAL48751.1 hypothetical protein [Dehalococcoidia bacterium]|tara:strand:- start:3094 stop:3909 length:816 start_codon:yes stop_codon:yes gene_type:complete
MTMESPDQETHWTNRLMIDYAELYLPFLEAARARAEAEVATVVRLLSEHGAAPGSRLLDAPCGIGRHAIPLAKLGYEVTGLDLSPLFVQAAVREAEQAGLDSTFVVGDAQRIDEVLADAEPFDAVVNLFTSHGYYGKEGDLTMFRGYRRLVRDGAVFVIQTVNRDWVVRNFEPEGLDKAGDIRIIQRRSFDFENSTIDNTWDFYEGGGENIKHRLGITMAHRVYSLHELVEVVEESGWEYLGGYSVEDGSLAELVPLSFDSPAMWLVARAA